jgi:hypothetical protein
MRLAYLEEPETWKRAADIFHKLAKNVDMFLQKSNWRFSKGIKVYRCPPSPKKFLYVKQQQKVSSILRAKFLAFLGDHPADDYRGHRRNHSCRKTDQSDNTRSQGSFLSFAELWRFSGASLAKQRVRHQRQHVPP